MTRILLVAAGGALGSVCRYLLDGFVYRVAPATFPFGTAVVNIAGCFAFGLLLGAAEARFAVGSLARTFTMIGVLGGFTTFSTFAFETFGLIRDGQFSAGLVNAAGQVVGGVLATWLGTILARLL
jgi:CrcB protein